MATRVEIDKARADVLAAQKQIGDSRSNILQTEKIISEELGKLSPRKRIPYTPRKVRSANLKYKRSLFGIRGEAAIAKEGLTQQESEINKYQTDVLQPAEAELSRIESYNANVAKENKEWSIAQKLVDRGLGWAAKSHSGIWDKIKQIYKYEKANKLAFINSVQEFQKINLQQLSQQLE